MKRNYLKVGDKSTANGVVVEGIPFCSHEGTEITFVGAKVSCPSCHSIGHIVATGPRLPMKMMGERPRAGGRPMRMQMQMRPAADEGPVSVEHGRVVRFERTGEHGIWLKRTAYRNVDQSPLDQVRPVGERKL
jgi:uncharacterized Zn-binding protein involved in type VI secretion